MLLNDIPRHMTHHFVSKILFLFSKSSIFDKLYVTNSFEYSQAKDKKKKENMGVNKQHVMIVLAFIIYLTVVVKIRPKRLAHSSPTPR